MWVGQSEDGQRLHLHVGLWQGLVLFAEMLLAKCARLLSIAIPILAILAALGVGGLPSFLRLAEAEAAALLLAYIVTRMLTTQKKYLLRRALAESGGKQ